MGRISVTMGKGHVTLLSRSPWHRESLYSIEGGLGKRGVEGGKFVAQADNAAFETQEV